MATVGSPWYVDFFRSDYLEVYDRQFTAERAEKEVAFAEKALQLKPGTRVLDLCCGQGRHSVLLAKHGFQVTALDLNPASWHSGQPVQPVSHWTQLPPTCVRFPSTTTLTQS